MGMQQARAGVCPDINQSIGHTIHDTLVHNPAIVLEKYTGAEAQIGIALYNALPDPGDDTGDTFYLAFDLRAHTAYMAVTQGDCLISNGAWEEQAGLTVHRAIETARARAAL